MKTRKEARGAKEALDKPSMRSNPLNSPTAPFASTSPSAVEAMLNQHSNEAVSMLAGMDAAPGSLQRSFSLKPMQAMSAMRSSSVDEHSQSTNRADLPSLTKASITSKETVGTTSVGLGIGALSPRGSSSVAGTASKWRRLKDHLETTALTIRPVDDKQPPSLGDTPGGMGAVYQSMSGGCSGSFRKSASLSGALGTPSSSVADATVVQYSSDDTAHGLRAHNSTLQGGVRRTLSDSALATSAQDALSPKAGIRPDDMAAVWSDVLRFGLILQAIRDGKLSREQATPLLPQYACLDHQRTTSAAASGTSAGDRALDFELPAMELVMDRCHAGGLRTVAALLKRAEDPSVGVDSAFRNLAVAMVQEYATTTLTTHVCHGAAVSCLVPSASAVVTLWRHRRMGKLYYRSSAAVATSTRAALLPSLFRCTVVVAVAWQGHFYTVSWLPPIASVSELDISVSAMVTAACDLISTTMLGKGRERRQRVSASGMSSSQHNDAGGGTSSSSSLTLPSQPLISIVQPDEASETVSINASSSHPDLPIEHAGTSTVLPAVCVYPCCDGTYAVLPGAELYEYLNQGRCEMALPCHVTAMKPLDSLKATLLRMMLKDSPDQLEGTFTKSPPDRAQFLGRLFHFHGAKLSDLMRVRHYVQRIHPDPNTTTIGRYFADMRGYLSEILLNEVVARTLKGLILSRANFSSMALQFLGKTTSPTTVAEAASYMLQRLLTSSKFIKETLLVHMSQRFPCDAEVSFELKELSVMDIVTFLKCRLGLEFVPLSKRFVIASASIGAANTSTAAAVAGYTHREAIVPPAAAMLSELSQRLSGVVHGGSDAVTASERSGALSLSLFYAAGAVSLKLPYADTCLRLALQTQALRGRSFNCLILQTVTMLRRYVVTPTTTAGSDSDSQRTPVDVPPPSEDRFLLAVPIVPTEDELPEEDSLTSSMVPAAAKAKGEAIVGGTTTLAAASSKRNSVVVQTAASTAPVAPATTSSVRVVHSVCAADCNWVFRYMCMYADVATGLQGIGGSSSAGPGAASPSSGVEAQLFLHWADAIVQRHQRPIDTPRDAEENCNVLIADLPLDETNRGLQQLDSTSTTLFHLTDSTAALFLSCMLTKSRWRSLLADIVCPPCNAQSEDPRIVDAHHHREGYRVVWAMCECAVEVLGGAEAIRLSLCSPAAAPPPKKNAAAPKKSKTPASATGKPAATVVEKGKAEQPAEPQQAGAPLSAWSEAEKHKSLSAVVVRDGAPLTREDLLSTLVDILCVVGLYGPERHETMVLPDIANTTSVHLTALYGVRFLPNDDPRSWALLCLATSETMGVDVVPPCCRNGLSTLLWQRLVALCTPPPPPPPAASKRRQQAVVNTPPSLPRFVATEAVATFLHAAFEADSVFTASLLERKAVRTKRLQSQRRQSQSVGQQQDAAPSAVDAHGSALEWIDRRYDAVAKTFAAFRSAQLANRTPIEVPKSNKNEQAVEVAALQTSLPLRQPALPDGTFVCSVCRDKSEKKRRGIEARIDLLCPKKAPAQLRARVAPTAPSVPKKQECQSEDDAEEDEDEEEVEATPAATDSVAEGNCQSTSPAATTAVEAQPTDDGTTDGPAQQPSPSEASSPSKHTEATPPPPPTTTTAMEDAPPCSDQPPRQHSPPPPRNLQPSLVAEAAARSPVTSPEKPTSLASTGTKPTSQLATKPTAQLTGNGKGQRKLDGAKKPPPKKVQGKKKEPSKSSAHPAAAAEKPTTQSAPAGPPTPSKGLQNDDTTQRINLVAPLPTKGGAQQPVPIVPATSAALTVSPSRHVERSLPPPQPPANDTPPPSALPKEEPPVEAARTPLPSSATTVQQAPPPTAVLQSAELRSHEAEPFPPSQQGNVLHPPSVGQRSVDAAATEGTAPTPTQGTPAAHPDAEPQPVAVAATQSPNNDDTPSSKERTEATPTPPTRAIEDAPLRVEQPPLTLPQHKGSAPPLADPQPPQSIEVATVVALTPSPAKSSKPASQLTANGKGQRKQEGAKQEPANKAKQPAAAPANSAHTTPPTPPPPEEPQADVTDQRTNLVFPQPTGPVTQQPAPVVPAASAAKVVVSSSQHASPAPQHRIIDAPPPSLQPNDEVLVQTARTPLPSSASVVQPAPPPPATTQREMQRQPLDKPPTKVEAATTGSVPPKPIPATTASFTTMVLSPTPQPPTPTPTPAHPTSEAVEPPPPLVTCAAPQAVTSKAEDKHLEPGNATVEPRGISSATNVTTNVCPEEQQPERLEAAPTPQDAEAHATQQPTEEEAHVASVPHTAQLPAQLPAPSSTTEIPAQTNVAGESTVAAAAQEPLHVGQPQQLIEPTHAPPMATPIAVRDAAPTASGPPPPPVAATPGLTRPAASVASQQAAAEPVHTSMPLLPPEATASLPEPHSACDASRSASKAPPTPEQPAHEPKGALQTPSVDGMQRPVGCASSAPAAASLPPPVLIPDGTTELPAVSVSASTHETPPSTGKRWSTASSSRGSPLVPAPPAGAPTASSPRTLMHTDGNTKRPSFPTAASASSSTGSIPQLPAILPTSPKGSQAAASTTTTASGRAQLTTSLSPLRRTGADGQTATSNLHPSSSPAALPSVAHPRHLATTKPSFHNEGRHTVAPLPPLQCQSANLRMYKSSQKRMLLKNEKRHRSDDTHIGRAKSMAEVRHRVRTSIYTSMDDGSDEDEATARRGPTKDHYQATSPKERSNKEHAFQRGNVQPHPRAVSFQVNVVSLLTTVVHEETTVRQHIEEVERNGRFSLLMGRMASPRAQARRSSVFDASAECVRCEVLL